MSHDIPESTRADLGLAAHNQFSARLQFLVRLHAGQHPAFALNQDDSTRPGLFTAAMSATENRLD
jgi:hypothetical protein